MKKRTELSFMWLPVAFALGAVAGGWSASEKLRRASIEPAAEKPAAKSGPGSMDVITKALNLPDRAAKRERPRAEPKREAASQAPKRSGEAARALPPEDLSLRIEEAKELWRTRSAIARETAISSFKLTEEGAAVFDDAIAKMNSHIGEIIAAIAGELGDDAKVTPELAARAMGELGIAFTEAYDSIAECVDPSQRAELSELSLADFVDPSVADPLASVQAKIRGGVRNAKRGGMMR